MPRGRPKKVKEIPDKNLPRKKVSDNKETPKKVSRKKKSENLSEDIPDNNIKGKRGRKKKNPEGVSENVIPKKKYKKRKGILTIVDEEGNVKPYDYTKFGRERVKNVVDLSKNIEACKEITASACFRPDIYLDYGCWECSLYQHCACKIKMTNTPKKRK